MAFGGNERITITMKEDFLTRIPNPTVVTLEGVGHFCQEEAGPEYAQLIIDFINGNPQSFEIDSISGNNKDVL